MKGSAPSVNNQRAIDKYKLTSLCNPSVLAISKVVISSDKYKCVEYKADISIKLKNSLLLEEANRIREGITSVDTATTFKIEQILASNDFVSAHQRAMADYKVISCITSQRIKQVTSGDEAPRSPRFLAK